MFINWFILERIEHVLSVMFIQRSKPIINVIRVLYLDRKQDSVTPITAKDHPDIALLITDSMVIMKYMMNE